MVRRIQRKVKTKGASSAPRSTPRAKRSVDASESVWQGDLPVPGQPPFHADNPPPTPTPPVDTLRASSDTGRAFVVRYAVRTHVGLVRDHNEDDFVILPDHGLFVVADGMGGHAAGKVASEICVKTIGSFFSTSGTLPPEEDLGSQDISESGREFERALLRANRAIFIASTQNPDWSGMGTTVVGIRLFADMAAICHAGDSRCYLLRSGRLAQVTADHSLSNFLRALGRDAEARIAAATMSNVIMRALGLESDVVIESQEIVLRPGDRFLLCSDGLSDLVPDHVLESVLSSTDLDNCCDILVQRALDAGGRDNITAMLIDVVDAAAHDKVYTGETVEVPRLDAPDGNVDWADTTGPLPTPATKPDPDAETPVPTGGSEL